MTENGSDFSLINFGLKEHKSTRYQPRTFANIKESDGTIYFTTDKYSKGLALTRKITVKTNRPFLLNPTRSIFIKWIMKNKIQTLNIAGSRGSKLSALEIKKIKQKIRYLLTSISKPTV